LLLFGVELLGAGLLAASVLPLSTAYSVSESLGLEATLDDPFRDARISYVAFVAVVPILVGTQALNVVLLLPLLVFVERLVRDREPWASMRTARSGGPPRSRRSCWSEGASPRCSSCRWADAIRR
jgi:Mn2+/Fe2+ NRAMP family transporter